MPRFELAGKFWSIEQTGKRLTTQFGKVGSPGQTRLETFATPRAARAGHDAAIAAKRAEGYKPAKLAPNKPTTIAAPPALIAAIDADPYDRDAYSVYADHLQAAGDPRGELIALQLANKTAAANRLLAKHADTFLGPLAAHTKAYDHSYDARRKQVRPDAFVWRYGFIHALRLSHNVYAEQASKPPYKLEGRLADVLRAVLAHPSGRFVAEIVFAFNEDPSGNLQDLVDVLAKHAPPTIRTLHFGDYKFAGGYHVGMHGHDTEISWYSIGNLGRLWKRVPGLRHLITQGGSEGRALGGGQQLGTIDLPNLVHAEFRTGGLTRANARAIAKARIPRIEHLEVWYGDDHYGGNATLADVDLLLRRTDLPALRHLGLRNAQFTDAAIERVAASKLLPQLRALDLSLGCMTDDGARELVRLTPAFAHLARIDVSKNYLTPDGTKLLAKTFGKKLVSTGQRDDPAEDGGAEARHPAVGE